MYIFDITLKILFVEVCTSFQNHSSVKIKKYLNKIRFKSLFVTNFYSNGLNTISMNIFYELELKSDNICEKCPLKM